MKNVKMILNEALKEIQPDKDYEKEIFEKLNFIIKKINQNQKNIKAILGGSGAKGTWLKTFDADIFALFGYKKFKDRSDKLSDILEKTLKKKFSNVIRLHGSRDYFQIKQNNFTFEIVPILKIQKAEQAKNITDVSPLHSKWVLKSAKIKDRENQRFSVSQKSRSFSRDFRDTTKSKILCAENHKGFSRTKNAKRFLVHKKLVDEMKLTKQFCQAQNVYGAESYIRGFSGYVCEILTVYYGSFLNLVKSAARWNERVIVDVQRYYKGKDVFKLVNTSKLISPLIVIDPVQKDRNAAAALSIEKFEAFKKAAREFLSNPSAELFIKKDLNSLFLKDKRKNAQLIIIKAKPLSGKIDVVGSKLLKIYNFLMNELNKHNFKITKSAWEWDKKNDAIFYFLFDKKELPKAIEIEGPPLKIKQHVENFKKIHKNTLVKNNKIFALEQRKFTKPEDLLKNTIKNHFVKERVKSLQTTIL